MKNNNQFSIEYYDKIIKYGLDRSYNFVTLSEFIELGCPSSGYCILRHDLDTKPQTLEKMLKTELNNRVKSSVFVRVTANDYNAFSYPVLNVLSRYENLGFEIGLHTSCVEYGEINKVKPFDILNFEYNALSNFFSIRTIAPHRDLNYAYNSLPYLEKNWKIIKNIGFKYQAYENRIIKNTLYVNEGFNPHLCWRKLTPYEAYDTGKSVYILTHNHWWYLDHPFEEWL